MVLDSRIVDVVEGMEVVAVGRGIDFDLEVAVAGFAVEGEPTILHISTNKC